MNISPAAEFAYLHYATPHSSEQNSPLVKETQSTQSGQHNSNSEDRPEDSHSYSRQNTNARSELSENEKHHAQELAARDREVRAHEAAHKAAGGSLAGAASFSYTTGPDGKRYATGGEVGIDTSKVSGDPQATIVKANRIRAAALAPASPSSQDQRVAAQAAQMAAEARAELAQQKSKPQNEDAETKPNEESDLAGASIVSKYDSSNRQSSPPSAANEAPTNEFQLAGQNQFKAQQFSITASNPVSSGSQLDLLV